MPSTSFVDGATVIPTDWLNEVDVAVNVTLSGYLADITSAKNVRLPAIEAPGWITNSRVSNIDWFKVTSRPTTMAGYGITDRPTLLNVRVFTTAQSGSTYVPTPGTARVYVEIMGGGGSGGRCVPNGVATDTVASSGGNSGTWASGMFTAPFTSVVLTIGAGGVCTTGGSGAGGSTSFGTLLSCPGGPGGADGTPWNNTSGNIRGPVPYPTTMSGNATGTPLLSVPGVPGSSASANQNGGSGGQSPYGQGGVITGPVDLSAPTQHYGAGGAGNAIGGTSPSTTLGGSGAPGVIIVWEYNS